MADYNVNMKQWNGSSFDNVLPLAFNSKALEGKSYDDIIQYAQSKNLLLYTGQYTGTGAYGSSNPTTLTFPFEPFFIIGIINDKSVCCSMVTNLLLATYSYSNQKDWFNNTSGSNSVYLRVSDDRKTVQFYNTNSASAQINASGYIYYYAAIGGYDMGGGKLNGQ